MCVCHARLLYRGYRGIVDSLALTIIDVDNMSALDWFLTFFFATYSCGRIAFSTYIFYILYYLKFVRGVYMARYQQQQLAVVKRGELLLPLPHLIRHLIPCCNWVEQRADGGG